MKYTFYTAVGSIHVYTYILLPPAEQLGLVPLAQNTLSAPSLYGESPICIYTYIHFDSAYSCV